MKTKMPTMKSLLLTAALGNIATITIAFTIVSPPPKAQVTSTALWAANVGVFFGTSTGSTETVADMIVEQLGSDIADGPFDVDSGDSIVESFRKYDSLIVGTPTWNTGSDTERSGTGWDELYYSSMSDLDLSGKKVAVFGLGDSVSYAENFSDAAGELHEVFQKLGCQMYGYVSQEGYLHEDSKSILPNGKFCGLLCDMVNQEELTPERVEKWVAQLQAEEFLEATTTTSAVATPEAVAVPQVQQTPEPVDKILSSLEQENAGLREMLNMDQGSSLEDFPQVAQTPEPVDRIISSLEQENADLRKMLDLEESSSLLDESIASHDTGYTPHTNPLTGKTMWTSADGRSCYFTDAPTTTTMAAATTTMTAKQSSSFYF